MGAEVWRTPSCRVCWGSHSVPCRTFNFRSWFGSLRVATTPPPRAPVVSAMSCPPMTVHMQRQARFHGDYGQTMLSSNLQGVQPCRKSLTDEARVGKKQSSGGRGTLRRQKPDWRMNRRHAIETATHHNGAARKTSDCEEHPDCGTASGARWRVVSDDGRPRRDA